MPEFVSAALAGEILTVLSGMYDYIVVDSPPAFTDVILKCFDMADAYVLLTTFDMPALKNLKVTLDTLDNLGFPRTKWQIVLNRSGSRVGLSPADIERTVGVPISVEVPSSVEVPTALNEGVTVIEKNPRHPVARAIMELAEKERRGSGQRQGAAREGQALTVQAELAMGLAERLNQAGVPRSAAATAVATPGVGLQRDEFSALKHEVHENLMQSLGSRPTPARWSSGCSRRTSTHAIQTVLAKSKRPLSTSDRARISQEIIDDILGNGPLEPLLRDPEVTEIMVNRADSIFIERSGANLQRSHVL